MNPQEIIFNIWARVRQKHLFPELPIPHVAESEKKAAMEMKGKQIMVSTEFCEQLSEKMPMESMVEALLDHGIAHYTRCPWDFGTHLRLHTAAKSVLHDKEMAQRATDTFIDVVSDTSCVKERETPLPELYRSLEKGKLDRVIAALYSKIWGIDLESPADEALVRRLSRIPYLKREDWAESLQRFSRLIRPLLEEEQQQEDGISQPPLGQHGLEGYSQDEIDQGLRDFAQSAQSLEEFRQTVNDFADELGDMGYAPEENMGRGKGKAIDADVLYYMKLAESYHLPVKKVPLEKSGSLDPHAHTPWELGKPFKDVDIWTSFGKIMPGLTQTWTRREGEIFGRREGTPDCVIVIDSSGSMTDPRRQLSHAVLGAGCASEAYLRYGSKVAVYNFSDAQMGGKLLLDFGTDRKQIYHVLCRYFGGGTNLALEELDLLHRKGQKMTPDIFLITDMQITNLESVIGYLSTLQSRITAVHIGENSSASQFKAATSKWKNISVFPIVQRQDIPKIILGQVREYLKTRVFDRK
ncbi:MAG: VWA domain-containing protein [Candidatus Tectomicrobia bacterium]|nr:VWA domain-containing protein [Candidatus Tectomicrobia bacterium]